MMMYVQLKHTHIISYFCSLDKNRIPALMGNIVNNQFLINTWEIIFFFTNECICWNASILPVFIWLIICERCYLLQLFLQVERSNRPNNNSVLAPR